MQFYIGFAAFPFLIDFDGDWLQFNFKLGMENREGKKIQVFVPTCGNVQEHHVHHGDKFPLTYILRGKTKPKSFGFSNLV